MDEVFAVVDWSGRDRGTALAWTLANDCAGEASRSVESYRGTTACITGVRYRDADDGRTVGDRHLAVHGTVCGGVTSDPLVDHGPLLDCVKDAYDGSYNLLVWDERERALLVCSDALGTRTLYYLRVGELLVVSSTLKAFRLLPTHRPGIDVQALAETIVYGHSLSCATMLSGVQAFPAESAVVFARDNTAVVPLPLAPTHSNASLSDLVASYSEHMARSTATWLDDSTTPLLSLSGGLDSRLALGYALRLRPATTAVTWGTAKSEDFRLAGQVAATAGVRHTRLDLTDEPPPSAPALAAPGWVAESFGNRRLHFYGTPWLRLLRHAGSPLIHGYLTDVLAGSILPYLPFTRDELEADASTTQETVRAWRTSQIGPVLVEAATPTFRGVLRESVPAAAVRAYTQAPGERTYERLMRSNLRVKQRLHIANSCSRMSGIATSVAWPYYTRANVEFALGLPLTALIDRSIRQEVLLAEFPHLATLPEASCPKAQTHRFGHLGRRVGLRVHGPGDMVALRPLVRASVPAIATELRAARELLADHLDMDRLAAPLDRRRSMAVASARLTALNVCAFLTRFYGVLDPAQSTAPIHSASTGVPLADVWSR